MNQYLNLSHNQLTGDIPSEIGNLNIFRLNLELNQLTGNIPDELGKLDMLVSLNLASNQLNGEIPGGICNIYEEINFLILDPSCF